MATLNLPHASCLSEYISDGKITGLKRNVENAEQSLSQAEVLTMARVTSLGLHTPVALPRLIAEGILPPDPREHLYQWETYVSDEDHGDVEEEVLYTSQCVAWSKGAFVLNVYRFDLDAEDVTHAILTQFPENSSSGATFAGDEAQASDKHSRALVVFLKSKAHIHFAHGSSHVVDVPFEIAGVFPAPHGIVIQRQPTNLTSIPPTPQVPVAPPNSFLSSQLQTSSSCLLSPSLAKSFGGTQPTRPSPLGEFNGMSSLFQVLSNDAMTEEEAGVASLYSLTGPLSDFGIVTQSLQHPSTRLSSKTKPDSTIYLDPFDSAECIVYVSPRDELHGHQRHGHRPLVLIATFNIESQTLTLWHGWYIDERSLSSMLKQRAEQKAARTRRRSSFLSAGTGTATPHVRQRETTRESLVAAGHFRSISEQVTSDHPTASSLRRSTRKQKDEEVMTSQMDPDYEPSVSLTSVGQSRRISSLNADTRKTHHDPGASFGITGGRRNASFGGGTHRKSFGHRKSRGSTPGSTFSRHPGDDALAGLEMSMRGEDEATIDGILQHIRTTHDIAGADWVLGSVDDSFKRELVVRKVHSFPVASSASKSAWPAVQIFTLADRQSAQHFDDKRLNVYVHHQETGELLCVRLAIKYRPLWPELASEAHVPLPFVIGEHKLGSCSDVTKIRDHGIEAVLRSDGGLLTSVELPAPLQIELDVPYRVYSTLHASFSTTRDEDIGKNRILKPPARSTVRLSHPGADGRFDEVDQEGKHHRRKLTIAPEDRLIPDLIRTCKLVLPMHQAQMATGIWSLAHCRVLKLEHREELSQRTEWIALAAMIFTTTIHLIDRKARAAINLSNVAAIRQASDRSWWLAEHEQKLSDLSRRKAWSWMGEQTQSRSTPQTARRDRSLIVAAALADELAQHTSCMSGDFAALSPAQTAKLMLALHVFREEQKLSVLATGDDDNILHAIIAQLGDWLGLEQWSYGAGQYYNLEGATEQRYVFVKSCPSDHFTLPVMNEPIGVLHWFEHALVSCSLESYPSLADIATIQAPAPSSQCFIEEAKKTTPRTVALSEMISATAGLTSLPATTVELMAQHGITSEVLTTLPQAVAAPFREAIAQCEREPLSTWSASLLKLIGRDDLGAEAQERLSFSAQPAINPSAVRDVQAVCHAMEHHMVHSKTKEVNRHAVSQLIFNEDRRLVDATSLMHFNCAQVAECAKQPDWSDQYHLEQQRRVLQHVTMRMIALPAGDGLLHFDSQTPLLTERYHLPGFSNACVMQPMGHTLTADRSGLTEEKVNWAYFHAGASAGLRISRRVRGIDTSWIAFNKPNDLTNRHAGLLLALGLRGHLKHLAKWLSFKYLTPKHTMTSVGLLLGLSASSMGTMDGLITRMLSVHITRMLPPGAIELNVSPITQTAGLMGIGLLYYNTQHRRMSEIMLSEVEHMELEDPDSGPDPLRNESYRLSAGFALGLINLAKGNDLRGLHGMHLPERLLSVAIGPRPVSAVHVFDRATAGAVMAMALVYMKSGDRSIARKIDIPDTEAQFDHVRPDMLLLRTAAKHVILWDDIRSEGAPQGIPSFTQKNLPSCYRSRFRMITDTFDGKPLSSADVPFLNITAGLVWALSLKHAGTGNLAARDEILTVLEFMYIIKGGNESYYYYDAQLARSTVRRCIDITSLAAATVMAGTGDLATFRYLRRLHGRTDAETPYGSHFAAHLAIGTLFLGGGTWTFGTSDLAIASLMCSFYPLFPTDVHDNQAHLQAFRHLWVSAAEPRCLVVEDIDTRRPIPMPITVTMKDGSSLSLEAPCLLPELTGVSTVSTRDAAYWHVTLNFSANPEHLERFKRDQRIFVRRCPASESHNSLFTATLATLRDSRWSPQASSRLWDAIFDLPAFKDIERANLDLVFSSDANSSTNLDDRGTQVDDQLSLSTQVMSNSRDALFNLRALFAWAAKARQGQNGNLRWLGNELVETLRSKTEERMRRD